MFKGKKVLVLGVGITGVSSAKALTSMGAKVVMVDSKEESQLTKFLAQLEGIDIQYKLGTNNMDLDGISMIVKSPGVPLNVPLLQNARDLDIEIVTDIELADRISNNEIVAISGTNGKTTTTTLVGELLSNSGLKTHVTGNIGVGILDEITKADNDDVFVVEASSFQLENTNEFKPKVSVLTNITPDHLKWHDGFENYANAKKKIYANQDENDYTILNYDDDILRELKDEVKSKLVYFSRKEKLDEGVFVDGEFIKASIDSKTYEIMKHKDIKIIGKHNLENSLAAIAVALVMGVSVDIIKNTLSKFAGVEHRLEEVASINSVKYYNDSKGTNPDSSIKALEALDKPIILIAGGYDKGSEFEEFIKAFNSKVEVLILMGETANKIKNTAIKLGFSNIYIVKDMSEAVQFASSCAKSGYNVLLSPACASWDMYDNFEIRGKHFKECVEAIRRLEDGPKEI